MRVEININAAVDSFKIMNGQCFAYAALPLKTYGQKQMMLLIWRTNGIQTKIDHKEILVEQKRKIYV